MSVCLLSLSTTSWSFPLDFSISFRASVKDMFSVTVPFICVCEESNVPCNTTIKSETEKFLFPLLKMERLCSAIQTDMGFKMIE